MSGDYRTCTVRVLPPRGTIRNGQDADAARFKGHGRERPSPRTRAPFDALSQGRLGDRGLVERGHDLPKTPTEMDRVSNVTNAAASSNENDASYTPPIRSMATRAIDPQPCHVATEPVSEPNCRASKPPKSRKFNRGARIRTGDLLLPKQARYRPAPRPVTPSTACLTPDEPRRLPPGPTAWMHAARLEPRVLAQLGGICPEQGRQWGLRPDHTRLSPTVFPMAPSRDARTPRPTEGSHRADIFNRRRYPARRCRQSFTDRMGLPLPRWLHSPPLRLLHEQLHAGRPRFRCAPPILGTPGEEGLDPSASGTARRILRNRLTS